MMWKMCKLYIESETGIDELGNPTTADVLVKTTVARFTPWTVAEIELEGREVTKDEQKFILPVPFASLNLVRKAKIDDTWYEVVDKIEHTPRMSAIRVRVYKNEIFDESY